MSSSSVQFDTKHANISEKEKKHPDFLSAFNTEKIHPTRR